MDGTSGYKFIKTIGNGSFSCVKLGIHVKTGTNVAVKIINTERVKASVLKIIESVELIQSLNHPHIMKIYEYFSKDKSVYVVMEYANGGDLFETLCRKGRFSELEGRRLFQQLISGVHYCHEKGIAHRDLKPENLLLDQGKNLKIADFGLSTQMYDGHFMYTPCGSPNYASPELVSGSPYCGDESDVWSCGVILFAILTGTLPFDDENIACLYSKIKNGRFIFPKYLGEEVKDLIAKMLKKEPDKRIRTREILKHSWVQKDFPEYLSPGKDHRRVLSSSHEKSLALKKLLFHKGINKGEKEEKICTEILADAIDKCFLSDPIPQKKQKPNVFDTSKALVLSKPLAKEPTIGKTEWKFGLKYLNNAYILLNHIFDVLTEMDCVWKQLSPSYRLRCKLRQPNTVKFEMQLYKFDHDNIWTYYTVDLQFLKGCVMDFLVFIRKFSCLLKHQAYVVINCYY